MRKSREKRRRQRNESMIAHRQTILSEFRDILGWNIRRDVDKQEQSIHNDHEKVKEDIEEQPEQYTPPEIITNDNEKQYPLYEVGKKINYEVPWIYIGENENVDADLSSINESQKGHDNSPTNIHHDNENDGLEAQMELECSEENIHGVSQANKMFRLNGKIEWFYVAIVATSITIIVVLVVVVIIQFT